MQKDRRSKRHNGNWKNNKKDYDEQKNFRSQKQTFHPTIKAVLPEQIRADEEAIKAFKSKNQPTCPICKQIIHDITTAINDKTLKTQVHFDCALESVSKNEKLEQNDKIAYIGQGRFGIIHYDNPHDFKHFSIKKIIETEDKGNTSDWRTEMADLYSKIR